VTPDGKNVLFSQSESPDCGRSATTRLFTVSTRAFRPEVLPIPRGDLTDVSPDGTNRVPCETSQENRTWKRLSRRMEICRSPTTT
jgi:hypothetical protein